jgi:23S rRNA-/tRNA-specific pseudouridylate synthase
MTTTTTTAVIRSTLPLSTGNNCHDDDDDKDDKEDEEEAVRCCWGGTTLAELVLVVRKEQVILYDDEHYTVVNKPPDLRMDGGGGHHHHECTIHNLLQFWYNNNDGGGGNNDNTITTFRHAHQLDYATSGVLLFAKTVAAARAASMAFEARTVQKVYTAVVHGIWQVPTRSSQQEQQDDNQNKDGSSWEIWTRDELQRALAATEHRFRQTRDRKSRQKKWVGYQPPHSLFQMWQGQQQKNRVNLKLLNESQWAEVWSPLQTLLSARERDILRTATTWKSSAIKKERNIIQAFQQAATIYNQLKGPSLGSDNNQDDDDGNNNRCSTTTKPIPMFVSLKKDDDDAPFSSFAIYLSVDDSPHKDEFRMTVPFDNPHVPVNMSHLSNNNSTTMTAGTGRPCLSVMTIVSHNMQDNTTTLRLEPWTGRRHQLRVHCAVAGHPVVGDVTYYNNNGRGAGGGPAASDPTTATTTVTTTTAKRLHLHSTRLQIPTIGIDVECYHPGFGMTIPGTGSSSC